MDNNILVMTPAGDPTCCGLALCNAMELQQNGRLRPRCERAIVLELVHQKRPGMGQVALKQRYLEIVSRAAFT